MTDQKRNTPPGYEVRKRGVYLLPSMFTLSALFFGFYAIVSGMSGDYALAGPAIYIAMFLDGLDGRVARLAKVQTQFGAELDSLSDMLSFGLAPALVAFSWLREMLPAHGRYCWLIAFLYVSCTALRLARFNVASLKPTQESKKYFQGLSTTAAAGVMAGIIWWIGKEQVTASWVAWCVLFIMLCLSLLKVSNVPYRSFKEFDLKKQVPFLSIITILVLILFIVADTSDSFLALCSLYALSGPVGVVWRFISKKQRKKKKKSQASSETEK